MKREIKFRAWDKENKIMLDSSCGDWISFDGVPYTTTSRTYDTPNIEIEKTNDYELMQFTGLKDKNGVDIYEGDFLKMHYGSIYSVEFIEKLSLWSICRPVGKVASYPFLDSERSEVIGNIYQNPELVNEAT